MSDSIQSGHHPDEDQLNAFVEQALPAHERQATLAHLAVCPDCRSVVALSMVPLDGPREQWAEPVHGNWFSGWKIAWAGVPAVAALVVFGIYIYRATGVGGRATPTQMAASRPPAPAAELDSNLATKPPAVRSPKPRPRHAMAPAAKPMIQNEIAISGYNASPFRKMSQQAALPSQLPVLSVAANGHMRLALDTENQVFFSADDGAHWKTVPAQWQGRAIRVAFSSVLTSTLTEQKALPVSRALPRPPQAAAMRAPLGYVASSNATVAGAVTDPSGAVIPGATITVTNTSTSEARTTVTNNEGRYAVDKLSPGSYRIEAQAQGFTKQALTADLTPARQTATDITLQVGASTDTVTVTGEAEALQPLAEPASPGKARFEITTDTGESWVSADGESWKRKEP
jgi:hypothetical protein